MVVPTAGVLNVSSHLYPQFLQVNESIYMPFVGTSFVTILLNEPHTGQLTLSPSAGTSGNFEVVVETEELELVVETFVAAAVGAGVGSGAGYCSCYIYFLSITSFSRSISFYFYFCCFNIYRNVK